MMPPSFSEEVYCVEHMNAHVLPEFLVCIKTPFNFNLDPGVEITRLVSPSSLLDQSLVRLLNIDDLTPFYLLVVTQVCDPKKTQHLVSLEGAKERLHLFKADLLEEGSFDSAIDGCEALVPTLNIPDAGSAEQRVVPLAYLPKYGGVKKLESVRLSELNIYVLNSPLQHHASDDMSVAVKLSMVPNPVVKSSCSYHTNGPDDVPIIEGCPPSTGPEPAHTDSVLTSTETPIDDEKDPSSK
ncbi:hypothetical protein F2Q69_00061468 [Brassica cretica]|uniref:Uncharacterized protein n=1 Tax=Brassica cretica TaxID=69181 RepID=A0A8S9RB04_BRACR|nr:hypothetical protein F2Q69_00061468 [Brassica cretica]